MSADPSGGQSAGPAPRHLPWAGGSLLAIAAGHLALGATTSRDDLTGLLQGGYPADPSDDDTAAAAALRQQRAFWFETSGAALLLLGLQTALLERRGVPPPRASGWALAAVAVTGGAALPASGFWALLVPAGLIAARRKPGGRDQVHRPRT